MSVLNLDVPSGRSRIVIGPGIATRPGDFPRERFVIADRTVRKIAKPWITGPHLVLPPGEKTKSLPFLVRTIRSLLDAHLERSQPIVAIGGGVVCDLAGFAASIFKRGVPVHFVPTTLLAQVDAAIGGKNGIDLPEGKNLLGTIRQPDSVRIDPLVLKSLPPAEIASGMAEIVKCGVIRDARLFELLEKNASKLRRPGPDLLTDLITRSVKVKVGVVQRDEREKGERAVLNYGHTIGHAIEACRGYRIRHGEAVSIGMEAAAFISTKLGMARWELRLRQGEVLRACGLPLRIAGLKPEKILAAMRHDKKRLGGMHRFVLPEKIGRVWYGVEVPEKLVLDALKHISSPLKSFPVR